MNELTGTKLLKFKFLCQTKAHHKCTQTSGLWVSITLDIWERSYDGIGGAAFKKDLPFVSKKNRDILRSDTYWFSFRLHAAKIWPWINWNIGTFCTLFRYFRRPQIKWTWTKCEYKGQENSARILKVVNEFRYSWFWKGRPKKRNTFE